MAAVDGGFDVTGLDLDERKVKSLNAGQSHVEDIPDAQVQAALDSGRYRAVASIDDVERFDVAVVSVPTPLKETLPDLSYIESASEAVATKLSKGSTVILESTTYPGTTKELVPILEGARISRPASTSSGGSDPVPWVAPGGLGHLTVERDMHMLLYVHADGAAADPPRR